MRAFRRSVPRAVLAVLIAASLTAAGVAIGLHLSRGSAAHSAAPVHLYCTHLGAGGSIAVPVGTGSELTLDVLPPSHTWTLTLGTGGASPELAAQMTAIDRSAPPGVAPLFAVTSQRSTAAAVQEAGVYGWTCSETPPQPSK